MSGDQRNILNGTLSLTSVLSLLSAGAIGVWVCANTLGDIKHSLDDQGKQIIAHGSDITSMKNQLWTIQGNQNQTEWKLDELKRQISKADPKP